MGETVIGPGGGPATEDGLAVSCRPAAAFCTYYRPGRTLRAIPLVATARLAVWGLGVPGLSVRGTARVTGDAGDDGEEWPGTEPPVQLLEGYVEYAHPLLTAQAGRARETNRFGFVGFDGARVQVRLLRQRLGITAYGGWGLARGIDLPVTSPELNPLQDFQPSARQILFGGAVTWSAPGVDARLLYQRENSGNSEDIVSERTAFDLSLQGWRGFGFAGGLDYDLAAGFLGSAEAEVTYADPKGFGSGAIGWRRYRPHFDLWDIWIAFSPVGYHALHGRLSIRPVGDLELQGAGEGYRYDDALSDSPLTSTEREGWRWLVRGIYGWRSWRFMAGMNQEFGPGASTLGFEGRADVTPLSAVTLGLHGRYMKRPLEYRFDESRVFAGGLAARWTALSELNLIADVTYWDERRDRPDAAAFDWRQLRLQFGASFAFASPQAPPGLPPSVLRMPSLYESGTER